MAILATQKVLTLDYWKNANQLLVGDYVFDKDGNPVRITMVQEYRATECYRVRFGDQLTISGDQHLVLPLETHNYRVKARQYKGVQTFRKKLLYLPLSTLVTEDLVLKHGIRKYSVQTAKPLKLPYQTLPVPPFIFGFWFFNKRSTKSMAPPLRYKDFVHAKFKDHGYKIKETRMLPKGTREFVVSPRIETHLAPDIPNTIPNNYLFGSPEQRLELLRGIIHAKDLQYTVRSNSFRFTSTSYWIIKKIQFLTESLGLKTNLTHNVDRKYYLLTFKSKHQLVEEQKPTPIKVEIDRRYIQTIEPIEPQMCVHIKTDGKDGSFLVNEGFIACR